MKSFRHLKNFQESTVDKDLQKYCNVIKLLSINYVYFSQFKFSAPGPYSDYIKFKSDHDVFEIYKETDHLGTWTCIAANDTNMIEIATINDFFEYLINDLNCFYQSQHLIVKPTLYDLWLATLTEDASYATECPIEMLEKIRPKLSSIAKIGILD